MNRPLSETERARYAPHLGNECPNLEQLGVCLGLVFGLGLSIKSGLKGWANIYLGNEDYWNGVFWKTIGPLLIAGTVILVARIGLRPLPRDYPGDVFPHIYQLIWLVLITQNVLAQQVTGPWKVWNEAVFKIYYVLLFILSGVIVHHIQSLKRRVRTG